MIYAHLFLPSRLVDPAWSPSPRFLLFGLDHGHPVVLFFFGISGYMIGLVTTTPATGAGVRHYLRNRAARLLPLTTFAVLLTWLLSNHASGRTVFGNFLFLQNSVAYPLIGSFGRSCVVFPARA